MGRSCTQTRRVRQMPCRSTQKGEPQKYTEGGRSGLEQDLHYSHTKKAACHKSAGGNVPLWKRRHIAGGMDRSQDDDWLGMLSWCGIYSPHQESNWPLCSLYDHNLWNRDGSLNGRVDCCVMPESIFSCKQSCPLFIANYHYLLLAQLTLTSKGQDTVAAARSTIGG